MSLYSKESTPMKRGRAQRTFSAVCALTVMALGAAFLVAGCGGGVELPPPDLTTYQTIAITPLVMEDVRFGMLTARDLGNQFEIALKQENEDVVVVFDESGDLQPVTDALTSLGLTLEDVSADNKLAGKLAEELDADIIIVGRASNIKLRDRKSVV